MKHKWILAAVTVVVVGVGLAVWSNMAGQDGAIALQPGDLKVVAMGKKIYDANCASCHGRDLAGQDNWRERDENGLLPAPPHDPSGHTWHHPDDMLFALTKYGPAKIVGQGYQSAMPGFDGILTDQEIIASLSYIKSRWPAEIRARHDQINQGAAH